MSDFSTDQGAPETKTDQLTFQVGEREYDAESATTKINAQDAHILKIEQENASFKESLAASELKLASATSVQEALEQLQSAKPQESQADPSTEGLSKEQIGEIANQQLQELMKVQATEASEKATQALATSTFEDTKSKLVKQFGEKTEQVMKDKATAMGVSVERLVQMASDKAQSSLLLESMNVSIPATQASPSASFNTSSIGAKAPEPKEGWYKGSSNSIMGELQRRRQLS